jgi:hypothetical protein
MVSGLLKCLINVRLLHWNSLSFSEHEALGEFYESLSDNLDRFVEEYQGKYSLVGMMGEEMDFETVTEISSDYLMAGRNMVTGLRTAAGFPQESNLQNVVDEIVSDFDRTIYKLRFLK